MNLAVVGLGRIGFFHAQHVAELANRSGTCVLAAVVDPQINPVRVEQLAAFQNRAIAAYRSVDELLDQGGLDAAVIASPTALHRKHAQRLIDAGLRVLVEKPLTESLADDRDFVSSLNAHHPHALMLAFQRRFDAPMLHAKSLVDEGRVGRPFKYVSILEDSKLMPQGYESPGLLQDMSVHNIDEVLWLSGRSPQSVRASGSRLYTHRMTPVEEDFDDALLQLSLGEDVAAQIHVSRNHVAGYRVETWIFGEEGVVHSGGFHQDRHEVCVEAYGREGPIDVRRFALRDYGKEVPEFMDRFGHAYAAELEVFVTHCLAGSAFPVDQNDGLRAMEVIDAATQSMS